MAKINRWWRPKDEEQENQDQNQDSEKNQDQQPDDGQPDSGQPSDSGQPNNQDGGQNPGGSQGGSPSGGGKPLPSGVGEGRITKNMAKKAMDVVNKELRRKKKRDNHAVRRIAQEQGISHAEAQKKLTQARLGKKKISMSEEIARRITTPTDDYYDGARVFYNDKDGKRVVKKIETDIESIAHLTPQQKAKKHREQLKALGKFVKKEGSAKDVEDQFGEVPVNQEDIDDSKLIRESLNPDRIERAFDVSSGVSMKRINISFSMLASKVAEDAVSWPIIGDDEWDVQAIMQRKYFKKPLSHCKQSRERSRLIVVLDSSPSCYQQATFFSNVATAALKFGDVEIYDAPNAYLRARLIDKKQGWIKVGRQGEFDWGFANRTILFFGDWDGASNIIHNSQNNKIFWFDCDKYVNHESYGRVDNFVGQFGYRYSHYKGNRYLCQDGQDFIKLIRKIK